MKKYLVGLALVLVSFSAFADCDPSYYGQEIKAALAKKFPAYFIAASSSNKFTDASVNVIKNPNNWNFTNLTFDSDSSLGFSVNFKGSTHLLLREVSINDNSEIVQPSFKIRMMLGEFMEKADSNKNAAVCEFHYFLESINPISINLNAYTAKNAICVLDTLKDETVCTTGSDLSLSSPLVITATMKNTPKSQDAIVSSKAYNPYN